MARNPELELRVTSLAPGGDGVAHVDLGGERRAVFVPHAAPGDLVRAEVDARGRPARGRIVALVESGPDRVTSPCRWSERCGGCDWMHVSQEAQARTHVEHVRAALPAPWKDVAITTRAPSAPLAYRSRARVHVRIGRGGAIEVGMHEAGTHDPVEVDTCVVLEPEVEAGRRLIASLLVGSRGRGDVQVALGAARKPVLEVRWSGEIAPPVFGRLEAAVRDGALAGARLAIGDATRPAVIGDPAPWIRGADGEPLRLAPGGFAQASEIANADLARHVAELAAAAGVGAPEDGDGKTSPKAVELHAGAGNLTVLLARACADLVTVESNRDACTAARENLAARGLQARVVEGDADTYAWSPTTRLLVLDPPRTGARVVAERLATAKVSRVVYVSCDAQTLGRDLAVLAEAYDLSSVTTFEMFPQTSHVETVVALDRRRGGRARGAAS